MTLGINSFQHRFDKIWIATTFMIVKTLFKSLALAIVIGMTSIAASAGSLYDIPFKDIKGKEMTLKKFKGKPILLVNVASKCGYTPQYKGLQELYKKYKGKGLVIVGFPSNDFGRQEPGTNAEILQFCQARFDVTFPMMAKISVKGKDKHPLYKAITEKPSPMPGEIKWNFNKVLIDTEGKLAGRYLSNIAPDSKKLVGDIEKLMK